MNYLRGVIDCIKHGGGGTTDESAGFTIDRENIPCALYLTMPVVGADPCRKVIKEICTGRVDMTRKHLYVNEELVRDFSHLPRKIDEVNEKLNGIIKIAEPGDRIRIAWYLNTAEFIDD